MGKTTLINELASKLPEAVFTKEPGSPLLEVNVGLRNLVLNNKNLTPFQRELLFYGDALGHKDFISKQPKETLIISDRGLLSHRAYLYGCMKLGMLGSDPDENYSRYGLCKEIIKTTCAVPDAIIYLRGSLELMDQRRAGTPKDEIEKLGHQFYKYVLLSYEDQMIAASMENIPVLSLDAKNTIFENTKQILLWLRELQNSKI